MTFVFDGDSCKHLRFSLVWSDQRDWTVMVRVLNFRIEKNGNAAPLRFWKNGGEQLSIGDAFVVVRYDNRFCFRQPFEESVRKSPILFAVQWRPAFPVCANNLL